MASLRPRLRRDTPGKGENASEGHTAPQEAPEEPEGPEEENELYPFVNVAAVLAGNVAKATPLYGVRTDGNALFYPQKVNTLIGDPESGKTLIATAVAADALLEGGSALIIDADHNGEAETIYRFIDFGVPEDILTDFDRFRMVAADDREQVTATLAALEDWHPDVTLIDSVGEIIGLYEGDSNSEDDYLRINRAVMAEAAKVSCVIAIDHVAKGAESRKYGASGSTAKKRSSNGLYGRVTKVGQGFAPTRGGTATISVVKDRLGAVRDKAEGGHSEPRAAVFELEPARNGRPQTWRFQVPHSPQRKDEATDVEKVAAMNPEPTSARRVREAMGWGTPRATRAYNEWLATLQEEDEGAEEDAF